jgi:hypothetical protein
VTTLQKGALAAGAILALSAFTKAKAGATLNFVPGAVHSVAFDGITPIIDFDLIVQNPSNQSFSIRGLVGNLTANDYQIGNITSYQQTYIRPMGNSVYRLSARLSLIGVVNDIIRAISGGGISQAMKFKAWANVDGFNVPISINYKIG